MESILKYSDTYGSIFPLIALIILWNKVPKETHILLWYFISSILIFGYSNYLADKAVNNSFLYHIFSILELAILLQYFKKLVVTSLVKKVINGIIITFLILSIFNIIFLEKSNSLNSNTQSIEFLLLIIFCFIYYSNLSKTDNILFFYKQPAFWIVTGFFIYFSSTIILFSFYKYAARIDETFSFWKFQEIMYLVKNFFITYGILCFNKMR